MAFTVEELSLIKIYSGITPDRDSVVTAMKDSLPLIEDEEIKDAVSDAICKTSAMTCEAFAAIDLSNTLD